MWAQLITMTLKPGQEEHLETLFEQLHSTEVAESGLLRTLAMRDQDDPSKVHTLVVFESEEKARARESDSSRNAAMQRVRALMAQMFSGPPQFTNLTVIRDEVHEF
jgi:quinol monooxygenase YgiN